jgi:hypothetical protein
VPFLLLLAQKRLELFQDAKGGTFYKFVGEEQAAKSLILNESHSGGCKASACMKTWSFNAFESRAPLGCGRKI